MRIKFNPPWKGLPIEFISRKEPLEPLESITDLGELEDRVYDEQYDEIKSAYGKKAAEMANYGSGVTELEGVAGLPNGVYVQTKIYGIGVLTSEVRLGDKFISHSFS